MADPGHVFVVRGRIGSLDHDEMILPTDSGSWATNKWGPALGGSPTVGRPRNRQRTVKAMPVLDAFHVVKLASQSMDEVSRRVQQDTLGHRGHAGDTPGTLSTSEAARPTPPTPPPTARPSPSTSWPPSLGARSPRSPAWAAPCASRRIPTWATPPPAERTTAAPKPLTGSSSSTGSSPRDYRNPTNYRLRMLLVASVLRPPDLR
ncbi:transposase [Actinotalea sp. K2]|uniref:transposase n=1 Tax=Actinotalea sp. K2 TaxID=2939438 RepID=UPI0035A93250